MRKDELEIRLKDAYQEGFLHAITQCQLNSFRDINPILYETLAEEGFDTFESTENITREWTDEQKEMLRFSYIRKL